MELPKLVLAIVLVTVSTANAFYTLVPIDKEVVYDYEAIIKAGTHYPASYASQFLLHGKLYLQADGNGTFAKLSDLTYKLYNGILDHENENEAHDVPLTKEIEELQTVFKTVYDSDGKIIGIETETNEKQYVRNIKNAIAAILQLDLTVKNQQQPYAFTTKEHSIYGYGDVNYNVVPHHDGNIEVHKLHNMIKSSHLYQYHVINNDPLPCDISYEDPIMHDSQRKYVIASADGDQIVKYIEAVGAILYYPHEANSDSQYLLVNQTFKLMHVVPIQQKFHIEASYFEDHLTYHMFPQNISAEFTPNDTVPDITLGRHVIDYQKLVPIVHEILKDMVQYLQENHIHMKQPDIKRGQSINRIHNILMHFDLNHLEEIHKELVAKDSSEDQVGVFRIWLQILPIIGTRASALMIKKLIINKEVTDGMAVELLRQFPRHVLAPTKDLVTEMEWMNHYDGHWDVKKSGILTFGSLVYKAYKYSLLVNQNQMHSIKGYRDYVELHGDEHDLKPYYEKYVTEYIEIIKNTTDYKTQMIYMLGLYNMKFKSILKHLEPMLTGVGSRQMRFQAILTIGAVLYEPDDIINFAWPILTNHEEHIELRIGVYYLIMESKPSASVLINIYWHMMHEPNEELYNFHYSYVNSLKNTINPCKQDFKLRLAQIGKYMHPPTHGSSSAYFSNYQDPHYKFSGGSEAFIVNTKEVLLISYVDKSQLFYRAHQDNVVFIKVYGHKIEISPNNTFKFKDLLNMPLNKDWQIEISLSHHLHIYATYFFDNSNFDELLDFVKIFVKNQNQEINHQYLHINYDGYEKVGIPTDFGVPALFEFLSPSVHKNNIKVTKEVTNKIINMYVDNKYVEWSHYRQGLSFYNPIIDVWQGINRFNSLDKHLPVRFDIGLNTQQKILQLSWKKHSNVDENIVGLRSHVLIKVFVKDNYQRNLLSQSSPHSKEWITVTNGDLYRNNYTIYNDDNLNTGHLWQMAVYDSEHRISNSSFVRIHNRFTQPFTKSFNSALSYYWATFHHWYRYLYMMPKQGIHGVMIRGEPSHIHAVTDIDLSIRFNLEEINETVYNPGGKLSTRVTYAVKNREQSLKTWDVTTVLDTNQGHTINTLKMYLTRIVPGLKDYKVCIDGDKKWINNQIIGNLKVGISQTPDGKCFNDDTVIDVAMIGKKSHEQEHQLIGYGECQYSIPYSLQRYHTMECSIAHTSLRHYTYKVISSKGPNEFTKFFWQWWDYLKGHYMWYYSNSDERYDNVGEKDLVLDIIYPMSGKEVDVSVTTKDNKYELTGLPIHHWQWFEMIPDSSIYSIFFKYWHSLGFFDHCYVYFDHHYINHRDVVNQFVPNDWTLYIGSDSTENPLHGVYIKHLQNKKIGLKVEYYSHTLEFIPQQDDIYNITKDSQALRDGEHYENWVSYKMLTDWKPYNLLIVLAESGLHLNYDGNHVVVMAPKYTHHWHGQCWSS